MILEQLKVLECIKCCSGEAEINNCSGFDHQWNTVVNLRHDEGTLVIVVLHDRTWSSHLWETVFDLESRKHQVTAEKQIEDLKVAIVVEIHASIVLLFSLDALCLLVQLIVTNNWENPEDECMYNQYHQPMCEPLGLLLSSDLVMLSFHQI